MSDTTAPVPAHVGIILDGNRRWAKAKGLPTLEGHRQGAEMFEKVSMAAFERGVRYVSAYVFSTENWQRTQEEVSYLMSLVIRAVERQLKTYQKAGIKLVILGSREKLEEKVIQAIDKAQAATRDNTNGTLALCFNYGGHQEIADAAQQLVDQGVKTVTPEALAGALYAPEIPPLDLVIRTSGEQRLSGFMLWRAAYAELYFSSRMWPDFSVASLDEALADYARRQRRFGV